MSNGSRRTSGRPRHERARRASRALGFLLLPCLTIVGGCHHRTLYRGPELQAELSSISAEDFFLLGVAHARSGDLLRAEQYLSAARQRGHDEAAVVYWLVRVCVAASRYQSALNHSAEYLRDHPAQWSLRLVVASIYEAIGNLARAQSELERIVTAEPERALPHYRLAMLYRQGEADRGRSMAHLEEYLRLTPQGPHAAEARSILGEVTEIMEAPRFEPLLSDPSARLGEAP